MIFVVVGLVDRLGEERKGIERGGVDSSSEDYDEILVVSEKTENRYNYSRCGRNRIEAL